MAYVQDFLDNEENTPSQSQDGQVLTADNNSPNVLPAQGGAGNSTSGGSEPNTGFTNISKYLKANQDQSKSMAGGIVNPIKTDMTKSQNDISKFSNDLIGNLVRNNFASGYSNNTAYLKAVKEKIKRNPDKVTERDYAPLIKGYSGPESVETAPGYTDLKSGLEKTDAAVKGLAAPGGLDNSLAATYGANNPYSKGQKSLDSFLVSAGPGQTALSDLQTSYDKARPLANFNENQLNPARDVLNKVKSDSTNISASIRKLLKEKGILI